MTTRYEPLPVVGGPGDGWTFTPLYDVTPGQRVRLWPDGRISPRAWAGEYQISDDGCRVVWVRGAA